MNRKMVLIGVIMIVILGAAVGYREIEKRRPQEVTFDQLEAGSDEYGGRTIIIEGFYFARAGYPRASTIHSRDSR